MHVCRARHVARICIWLMFIYVLVFVGYDFYFYLLPNFARPSFSSSVFVNLLVELSRVTQWWWVPACGVPLTKRCLDRCAVLKTLSLLFLNLCVFLCRPPPFPFLSCLSFPFNRCMAALPPMLVCMYGMCSSPLPPDPSRPLRLLSSWDGLVRATPAPPGLLVAQPLPSLTRRVIARKG